MPIRDRNGKLEWRFKIAGHEYSHITDLADTPKNRVIAMREEAEARRLVLQGRSTELAIQPEPFSSAADAFCQWADGEYAAHPNSAKRLRGSMTSAKVFFGKRPLSAVIAGPIEDYKSWRRGVLKVEEVTLRHDLHALSLLFQYGKKQNWCRSNPIEEIDIPSDKDAARDLVLTPDEEQSFFGAIEQMTAEYAARRHTKMVQALKDVRDLSTLILNQGCRPEELRALPQAFVNLFKGTLTISKGKSDAAKRTLPITEISRFVLSARLAEPGPWVFPSRRGAKSSHMGQHQRLWGTIVKRAGIPDLVMYDLRHTFATRAVERGMELPQLMAILGHANLRSVMRYIHMKQGHINQGMRTFESAKPYHQVAKLQSKGVGEPLLPAACPPTSVKMQPNAGFPVESEEELNAKKIN